MISDGIQNCWGEIGGQNIPFVTDKAIGEHGSNVGKWQAS